MLAAVLAACSYSVHMTQYPHLKTVRVMTFENRSTEYGIQEDLLSSLVSALQSDNQLKVVELSPDCTIDGVILDYKNEIYNYDENDVVTQYQVKMLVSITMTDLVKNEVLWQNEALLLTKAYQSANAQTDTAVPQNEEEARQEIYSDLYDQLMKNTLQSW